MDLQLFLLLLAGHYLADFALQPQFMAEKKRLVFIESWGFHNLTAHAFIHGLTAGLLSQRLSIAIIVGITHWIIDFGKASQLLDDKFPHTKGARSGEQAHGLYGINIDQALHIAVLILAVVFLG